MVVKMINNLSEYINFTFSLVIHKVIPFFLKGVISIAGSSSHYYWWKKKWQWVYDVFIIIIFCDCLNSINIGFPHTVTICTKLIFLTDTTKLFLFLRS